MITLLRVDHRLLHGQVAFSWTQYVGADCILIANDSVPGDKLRKTTIKLAKPPSVKLVIKNVNDSIEAIKAGLPINIIYLLLWSRLMTPGVLPAPSTK